MLSVFFAFSFGTSFSSEFVRVRVFFDCCFSCLSLGTCDAHIFISSHDRSSTLCSAYTHVHRSTTCCLVGRIVPLFLPLPPKPQTPPLFIFIFPFFHFFHVFPFFPFFQFFPFFHFFQLASLQMFERWLEQREENVLTDAEIDATMCTWMENESMKGNPASSGERLRSACMDKYPS